MNDKCEVYWIIVKTSDGKIYFSNAVSYSYDLEPFQMSIYEKRNPFVSWMSINGTQYTVDGDKVISISVDGSLKFKR